MWYRVAADDNKPETGVPFSFRYRHNTTPSHTYGDFGETYGQHVEPAGKYVTQDYLGTPLSKGWEGGDLSLQHPLVLPWGQNGLYTDPSNWKHQVSAMFGGKTGKKLSLAIVEAGYDGIVTMDQDGTTAEIVDLRGFTKSV